MKRRSLLATIGLAAGGGAVLGTNAFTSVEAERSITVGVSGDSDALLALNERPNSDNGEFANITGGLMIFDINDVLADGEGEGPGSQSVYTFDNVFGVQNQGTQDVFFEVEFEDINTLDGVGFYVGENDDRLLDGEDNVAKIPVGEEADMGIYLDTSEEGVERGTDRDIEDITAVITASAETDTDDVTVVDDITI